MTKKIRLFRSLTRRSFLKLLGGTTTAVALSACGTAGTPTAPQQDDAPTEAPQESDGEPQRGGTLHVACSPNASTRDPALLAGFEAWNLALAIHEPLVHIDHNRTLHPLLVTDWEASDDGLEWTFALREGVTFHVCSPFSIIRSELLPLTRGFALGLQRSS